MFTSRKLGYLILIAALVLVSTSVVFAQDRPTVTVWFNAGSQPSCTAPLITEGFNSTSQTAQVEITDVPEMWDVARTAVAGGGGPDVVISPGPSFVYEMAAANLILPLDDYAAALGWNDSFVPWALSLGTVDGTLYSLPNELETLILYYNKTLFEENGWEPPTTIDELMADDYQIIQPGGVVQGKAETLASLRSDQRHWEIAESDQHDVRVYGDTAVVIGRWRGRGINHGQPFDYAARYLCVWVKRAGRWQMVADQSTELG